MTKPRENPWNMCRHYALRRLYLEVLNVLCIFQQAFSVKNTSLIVMSGDNDQHLLYSVKPERQLLSDMKKRSEIGWEFSKNDNRRQSFPSLLFGRKTTREISLLLPVNYPVHKKYSSAWIFPTWGSLILKLANYTLFPYILYPSR